jgi:hypothetical protein
MFPDAFKFVFLRDPVERYWSSHQYLMKFLPIGNWALGATFEDFITDPSTHNLIWLWTEGCEFDFVGFQETYREDVTRLANILGWRGRIPLDVHHNVTDWKKPMP